MAHTFTLTELTQAFAPFLDRLVEDHGNKREDMIAYHLTKLVGLELADVLRKMPRGPRGHWTDLMDDIRAALREIAE